MKLKLVLFSVFALAMLVSCATVSTPIQSSGLNVKLEPKGYDVLGDVVLEGTMQSVMGLFTWGGATYNELFEVAKKKYQADDVINISIDKKNTFIYIFYFTQTYILRGIAIKYK